MKVGEKISAIRGNLFLRNQPDNYPFDLLVDIAEKKCWTILILSKFSELSAAEKAFLAEKEDEFSKYHCSFYTCTNEVSVELDTKNISIVTSPYIPATNGKTLLLLSSEGNIVMSESVDFLSDQIFDLIRKQVENSNEMRLTVSYSEIVSKSIRNLLEMYSDSLKESPILTKSITSCVIAGIGEIIGSFIHNYRAVNSRDKAQSLTQISRSTWEIVHRLLVFGAFGLTFTGPFFHWWYGNLHKYVSSWNLPKSLSVIIKVLLNQLVMTPPFLLFTISYLQFFLTFDREKTIKTLKATFATALFVNWKVWTLAQVVNFSVVPQDYQVLFGNIIALWWNIYLSLISNTGSK